MASIIDKIPAILVMEICKQVLVWLESTTRLYEMLELRSLVVIGF
jgi:hypothetical protein